MANVMAPGSEGGLDSEATVHQGRLSGERPFLWCVSCSLDGPENMSMTNATAFQGASMAVPHLKGFARGVLGYNDPLQANSSVKGFPSSLFYSVHVRKTGCPFPEIHHYFMIHAVAILTGFGKEEVKFRCSRYLELKISLLDSLF